MGTRLTIVRHGETEWNLAMRLQGHGDSPLTEKGLKQVKLLSKTIHHRSFDLFVSSDLGRAIRTAEIVNKNIGLEINGEPGLRERAFGVMEGLTLKQIKKDYPDTHYGYLARNPVYEIPNGESLNNFYARVINCIENLVEQHKEKSILVVAHGGVLDCMMRKIFNLNLDDFRCFAIPNTSVNTFSINGDSWLLEEWGNIDHLNRKVEALNEFN